MRNQDKSSDMSKQGPATARGPRSSRGAREGAARQTLAIPASHALASRSPQAILSLQRAAGNAAVAELAGRDQHVHGAGCSHGQPVQRSSVDQVIRSAGAPLAEPVRQDMEARFGADFGDVRLHTDAAARRSAAEMGARAYTSGSHVVIGEGGGDNHTLAHELTHVIQQRRGPVAGTDNGNGLRISDPSDRFEREAEANARQVMSGPVPQPRVAEKAARTAESGGSVQRMFSWKRTPKAAPPQGPPRVTVQVGDDSIPMILEGGFYRFQTEEGGTAFIHDQAVTDRVVDPTLAPFVIRYINGGIPLYRGIPRWHPTWHSVLEGSIPPLGKGFFPSFDTRITSFIPFAPTEIVARSAAVSANGMGEGDRAEYVEGYSTKGEHEVGMLATITIGPHNDVGFFNATEIQARGPLTVERLRIFTMSTSVGEAMFGSAAADPQELRVTRPPTPTEAQKDDYKKRHGGLRR